MIAVSARSPHATGGEVPESRGAAFVNFVVFLHFCNCNLSLRFMNIL